MLVSRVCLTLMHVYDFYSLLLHRVIEEFTTSFPVHTALGTHIQASQQSEECMEGGEENIRKTNLKIVD